MKKFIVLLILLTCMCILCIGCSLNKESVGDSNDVAYESPSSEISDICDEQIDQEIVVSEEPSTSVVASEKPTEVPTNPMEVVPGGPQIQFEGIHPNAIIPKGESCQFLNLTWQVVDSSLSKVLEGFPAENVWMLNDNNFADNTLQNGHTFLYLTLSVTSLSEELVTVNLHNLRLTALDEDKKERLDMYELQTFNPKMYEGHDAGLIEIEPEETVELQMLYIVGDQYELRSLYLPLTEYYEEPTLEANWLALGGN